MYGYIYKTTNLINDKIYIGQKHSNTFLENKYLGSGYLLKKAITKYGKENFKVEFLESANSKIELDRKEIQYIALYNSTDSDIGYNIAKGGQGGQMVPPHIQSEEEKLKRSESLKKAYLEGRHRKISTKGIKLRKRTEEERKTNSERNKNKVWIKNEELQIQKTCQREELDNYLKTGWIRGRLKNKKPAWNKGLSKDTDDRLKQVSENRKKLFEEKGPIGCYGIEGNNFQKGGKKKDLNI